MARKRKHLLSKQGEFQAETLRLLELFEEQYHESPGYLYDPNMYLITIGTIVMHRVGCELSDAPENYNPSHQLEILQIAPAMKEEIEEFLMRNRMDKPETYYILKSDKSAVV